MNKRQKTSNKIILPTMIGSFVIIGVCIVLLAFYLPGWREKVNIAQSTRTAIAADENATAIALSKTAIEQKTQLALSNAQTLTAAPTFTPLPSVTPSPTLASTPTLIPTQMLCDAKVSGVERALYFAPGVGYRYKVIGVGTPVKVLGRFADRGWLKVSANNEDGWMRSDSIKFDNNNCNNATVYSISYLLGLDRPDTTILLNDTFASGENTWYDSTSTNLVPVADVTGEQQLVINTKSREVISTDNSNIVDNQAFRLITSVSLTNIIDDGFVGIRFRDDGTNYYEIQLFPGEICNVNVIASGQKINNFTMDRKACVTNSMYIELSFSSSYLLDLRVNGYDVMSSYKFNDLNSQYTDGTIRFVVNKSKAAFDFVTIVTP